MFKARTGLYLLLLLSCQHGLRAAPAPPYRNHPVAWTENYWELDWITTMPVKYIAVFRSDGTCQFTASENSSYMSRATYVWTAETRTLAVKEVQDSWVLEWNIVLDNNMNGPVMRKGGEKMCEATFRRPSSHSLPPKIVNRPGGKDITR